MTAFLWITALELPGMIRLLIFFEPIQMPTKGAQLPGWCKKAVTVSVTLQQQLPFFHFNLCPLQASPRLALLASLSTLNKSHFLTNQFEHICACTHSNGSQTACKNKKQTVLFLFIQSRYWLWLNLLIGEWIMAQASF